MGTGNSYFSCQQEVCGFVELLKNKTKVKITLQGNYRYYIKSNPYKRLT